MNSVTNSKNIRTYLDLSTSHLEASAAKWLASAPILLAFTVARYDYGAYVSVPDFKNLSQEEISSELYLVPESLITVLKYAADKGVTSIRFDADAGQEPGLPVYDW